MGSISLPNGESVYFADAGTTYSAAAISAAEASSVAALMGNRERFDYVWANAAARTAQTGMVQGSRGYQVDTKTEYIYDPTWRLASPYIEFTASSKSISALTYTPLDGWSVDNTRSSDSTIVTVSGHGFTFLQPGIYSISSTNEYSGNGTGAFQDITTDNINPPTDFVSIAGYMGNVSTLAVPAYRILASNTPLYLWGYNPNSGSSMIKRVVRIHRIG